VIKSSGLALAVVLVASNAMAQGRRGSFPSAARFGDAQRNRIIVVHERRAFNPAYAYYGAPFFYSDYYEPSDLEYQAPEPSPPPIQVQVKTEPLPDPVLLELHGSRWVRVTNFGESSDQAVTADRRALSVPVKEQPPAILVYRDGHMEELTSYSIIGGSIYTKANYWITGSWTRTIAIADLDIPATLKENEKRSVDFELPSGPNEVMLRP